MNKPTVLTAAAYMPTRNKSKTETNVIKRFGRSLVCAWYKEVSAERTRVTARTN